MQTLVKQSYEERLFSFDFSSKSDGTISSIVSVVSSNQGNVDGSSNVTISSEAYSGLVVSAIFIGGTSGETYKLTCKVIASDGQKLELDGLLRVQDE